LSRQRGIGKAGADKKTRFAGWTQPLVAAGFLQTVAWETVQDYYGK
jgi:hypothetical protein